MAEMIAPRSGIKPAKAKATVPANYMEILKARMAALKAGPEPKVVEVKTEMVPEGYILKLKERPLRRPTVPPEHYFKQFPKVREPMLRSLANVNLLIDVQEDMLRQYEQKGHAVVGIRVMDNGLRNWFIVPEEATAQALRKGNC